MCSTTGGNFLKTEGIRVVRQTSDKCHRSRGSLIQYCRLTAALWRARFRALYLTRLQLGRKR